MFGLSSQMLGEQFLEQMHMAGELSYFLGIQVNHKCDDLFDSQRKYDKNLVNNFELEKASVKRTPTATHIEVTNDENVSSLSG